MAAKATYTIKIKPSSKKEAVTTFLSDLQNLSQHKWIPIEGIQASSEAFCTPRQADWMVDQVASNVEGATLELQEVPALADEPAST